MVPLMTAGGTKNCYWICCFVTPPDASPGRSTHHRLLPGVPAVRTAALDDARRTSLR